VKEEFNSPGDRQNMSTASATKALYIHAPQEISMSQWDRLQQIRELRDRNLSVQELAQRLHMTHQDVQQALAELKRRYP